jgi:hypothetical protein
VRYLTRVVTPEEYDEAVRRVPEMCPMYYMGDRRTGRQLLNDFDADAASPFPCATPTAPTSTSVLCYGGDCRDTLTRPAQAVLRPAAARVAVRGGWLARLDRIAAVVSHLAAHLAAAPAVTWETWVHGVRECIAATNLRFFFLLERIQGDQKGAGLARKAVR